MVELYINNYQIPEKQATSLINQISQYPSLFVDHMMQVELGLLPPDQDLTYTKMLLQAGSYSLGYIMGGLPTFYLDIPIQSVPVLLIGQLSSLGLLHHYYRPTSGKLKRLSIWLLTGLSTAFIAYGISEHITSSFGIPKISSSE